MNQRARSKGSRYLVLNIYLFGVFSVMALYGCEDDARPPTCMLNSDCPLPESCLEGVCRLECIVSRDCPNNTECIESRCVDPRSGEPGELEDLGDSSSPPDMMSAPPRCQDDSSCDLGSECLAGDCVEVEGFCQQNRDCSSGQVCSGVSYRCVEEDTPRVCVDVGECLANEMCLEGRCQPTSEECSGEMCLEEPQCERDRDCPSPQVCRVGRCEPECVESADCESPLICEADQCVPECVEDRDCMSGEYCLKGECGVECTTQEECEAGFTCRLGRCEEGCASDEECDGALRCVEGMCAPECVMDSECVMDQRCEMSLCVDPEPIPDPYSGTFLISSSTPIRRCNELVSINFDPRVAQTAQDDQSFTLTLVNPPTTYVGQINQGSFTVSWSGLNGNTEHCGALNTSNTYVANFMGPDLFSGVLTVDFFFQVGSCDCRIQWPIIGVRQ